MSDLLSPVEQRMVVNTFAMINTMIAENPVLVRLPEMIATLRWADSVGPLLDPTAWRKSDHKGRASGIELMKSLNAYREAVLVARKSVELVERERIEA